NRIFGGGGNDIICGGFGRDRILGGRGKDTLDGKKGNDYVRGGRGSDEVDGGSGRDRVRGGSGNDAARGGPGRDDVEGGLGDDALLSRHPEDEAFGGPGSDECFGSFSVEESCGVAGSVGTRVELYDSLTGAPALAIAGDAGVDEVHVGYRRGRFLVRAGAGNLVGLGDPRHAAGRRLRDGVVCTGEIRSILVSLGAGGDRVVLGRSLPSDVAVTIDGGSGSDRLRGGRGGDTLYGGDDGDPD